MHDISFFIEKSETDDMVERTCHVPFILNYISVFHSLQSMNS